MCKYVFINSVNVEHRSSPSLRPTASELILKHQTEWQFTLFKFKAKIFCPWLPYVGLLDKCVVCQVNKQQDGILAQSTCGYY